jgi:hypothetical protein
MIFAFTSFSSLGLLALRPIRLASCKDFYTLVIILKKFSLLPLILIVEIESKLPQSSLQFIGRKRPPAMPYT